MLMIDHFLERETKLLEISKRREEKYLNSNVRRIFLGGYFAISHLLHALCHIALFTALALGRFGSRAVNAIRHRERVVTSTYISYVQSNHQWSDQLLHTIY